MIVVGRYGRQVGSVGCERKGSMLLMAEDSRETQRLRLGIQEAPRRPSSSMVALAVPTATLLYMDRNSVSSS